MGGEGRGQPGERGVDTMRLESGVFRAESRGEVIYALDCGGAFALVDVGSEAGLSAKLEQLAADGLDPAKTAAVFLTHRHEDHVGALPRLRAEISPRVLAHRLCVEHLPQCIATAPLHSELIDYTVDQGDVVELGDLVFRVHHLPGHTPDSVAWQTGDLLFAGDVIRCDGGIGWMDVHWGSCLGDYRSSLQRLRRIKTSSIYPGHGECGPMSDETVEEALRRLDRLAEADGSLLEVMGRPAPRRGPGEPAKTVRLSTALGASAHGSAEHAPPEAR